MTNVTPAQIEEHSARKTLCISVKFGLVFLCEGCRQEIFQPTEPQLPLGQVYKWRHKESNRRACYNDELDGTAFPMDKYQIQSMYDDIMDDELYYTGQPPYGENAAN